MDYGKISLPEQLISDLYRDQLVVIDNEIYQAKQSDAKNNDAPPEELTVVSDTVAKSPYNGAGEQLSFLGDNRKHITIIVRDEQAIHLQDEPLQILSAILSACRFNLGDVAILNIHTHPVNDRKIREQLAPAVVLLFGVDTGEIELPFSIPEYRVQQFDNCNYLQAVSLDRMKGTGADAKLQKSKLWICLQNLFTV
ncbi:MAG TPA: hypothetical protein VF145_01895 [Chitinophagaceae bacterium]